MSDQPAPFTTAPPTPYRVTVSVELAEGAGWSLVELTATDRNAFLALHTAAAAAEESLHVHPTTRNGSTRATGRHAEAVTA